MGGIVRVEPATRRAIRHTANLATAPDHHYTTCCSTRGRTGFDMVVSRGELQAEVPGGLVKSLENRKCGI